MKQVAGSLTCTPVGGGYEGYDGYDYGFSGWGEYWDDDYSYDDGDNDFFDNFFGYDVSFTRTSAFSAPTTHEPARMQAHLMSASTSTLLDVCGRDPIAHASLLALSSRFRAGEVGERTRCPCKLPFPIVTYRCRVT
jgi:hypothetical protein